MPKIEIAEPSRARCNGLLESVLSLARGRTDTGVDLSHLDLGEEQGKLDR